MMEKEQFVRFDWAMKRLLRDKANFGVLEGLITTLLGMPVKIQRLLESESNQEDESDKQNRVDILAENDKGELFIVEVQNENEFAYFHNRGQGYEHIRKIYSINIVYFNLGNGTDVVYHGKTEFRGIHNGELLSLSPFQQQKFQADAVSDLYPEYFILKVNDFNRWSRVPLEQWIYVLNTGDIPEDADAPGLNEAREKFRLARMTKAELASYYRHLDNVVILRDNITTARIEGREEGLAEGKAEGLIEGKAEGKAEGLAEGKAEIARKLKAKGTAVEFIAEVTGLSKAEIDAL